MKEFEEETKLQVITGTNSDKYVVVNDLDTSHIEAELRKLHDEKGFDSVAVVLMHSFACPEHELAIGEIARKIGFTQVSLSH